MSWLQSAASRTTTWAPEYEREPSTEAFAAYSVVVERDEDTGNMVTEHLDGHTWVVAYPSYEALTSHIGALTDTDHIQLAGRELKSRLRSAESMAHVGILWRATRDTEHPVLWPRTAPVARVSLDP